MRFSKQVEESKRLIMQAVEETGHDELVLTVKSMVESTESMTGKPVSELGLMVIVSQVGLITVIDRLSRKQPISDQQIDAALGAAAQTLSAYLERAESAISEWEATDSEWNDSR